MMANPITIDNKKASKLRHEFKHAINKQADMVCAMRLRHLLRHDPNADSHGSYRVSSLYFDTPYDKALREKMDGINRREKFRMRYYGENTDYIRLEKKFKVSGLCGKHSAVLSRNETEDILNGNYDFLLQRKEPLCKEFYSKLKGQLLRPKTMVVYDREAFLYTAGNVRITFDRNLRTALNNKEFLNTEAVCVPVSDAVTVLEVKYDEFIPEFIAKAVNIGNTRAAAYSKYAVCRKYD